MEFIPARESSLFISFFKRYVYLLFKRRFEAVWISQEYKPGPESKTIYYLNHNSWWDGLIPLLLNEYCLHQQARALMEDKQMKKYLFFKKIGAFSINRENPKKALVSLRYAIDSLKRKNACLFIYPEGTIKPQGSPLVFEGGLSWIHSKLPDVDYVPIGIYIHTIRHDKPEMHIHIGQKVSIPKNLRNEKKTEMFEQELTEIIGHLRKTAGFSDRHYKLFVG